MDPKKQDLTPELKQIYERVMNTQVKKPEGVTQGVGQPTPPAAGQTPSVGTLSGGAGLSGASTPAPPPPPPLSNVAPNPTPPQGSTQPNEGFLSSVPPRPVTESKSFVFTGNKITTPQSSPIAGAQTGLAGGKKISGKIIALLVVVLFVVWAVFWTKFFGLF